MRADSSAMRSPSRSRSGGASAAGGAAPSATASVVVSLAPGANRAVVAAVATGSVVAGSGGAAGVGGRGSVLVSGAMPPWYTRYAVPPCQCRPVDEPIVRFGLCGPNPDAAGRERALRAEMRAKQAGPGTNRAYVVPVSAISAQNHVKPLRPASSDFLDFFSGAGPQRIRRYGLYSSRSKGHWTAFLLARVYEFDPLACPGSALRRHEITAGQWEA